MKETYTSYLHFKRTELQGQASGQSKRVTYRTNVNQIHKNFSKLLYKIYRSGSTFFYFLQYACCLSRIIKKEKKQLLNSHCCNYTVWPLTIVVISFDTFRALVQSVVIKLLLSQLVPEACFQGAAEGSKLQLEVCSGRCCFTGVRCHHNSTNWPRSQVLQAVKWKSCGLQNSGRLCNLSWLRHTHSMKVTLTFML